jgi:adenylate kinase
VTEQLIFPELSDGFVLDGYPRTIEQVKRLGEYLKEHGPPLDAAVELVVPDETLAARLSLRAEEERRIDDTADVFLRRLEAYHQLIEPIREYYGDRLIQIDGTWSEDEVFKRLMDAIEARA